MSTVRKNQVKFTAKLVIRQFAAVGWFFVKMAMVWQEFGYRVDICRLPFFSIYFLENYVIARCKLLHHKFGFVYINITYII